MRVFRQVLAKIHVVHHFINKGERVAGGGVHPEERDDISLQEFIRCPRLLEEPLS
jgi:hypothetical protein